MADFGRGLSGAASGAAAGTALFPGIGTAVGGIAGALGGLFSGPSAEDKMAQLQQEATDAIRNVDIPKLQQLQVQLQSYREAGLLTPELEQTVYAPESLMGGVSTDPRLKEAQMNALSGLQGMSKTGLNATDKSMLDQIQRNAANSEHAKEQQILQDMQQRGQGGAGAELASKLSSAQNSANTAASQGLQVGATATQRALEALMNSGQLGGQMRGQEFGEQSQKAQAQDVINQFNARNRQAVINQNVGIQNNAQAANLGNKQDIMNKNTGVANQQQEANVNAVQNDYYNRLRKAQGIYGANESDKTALGEAQQRSNDAFSGTMSGIASAAPGIGDLIKKMGGTTLPYKDVYSNNSPDEGVIGPPRPRNQTGWT